MPGQGLKAAGSWNPRICRQPVHECDKSVSHKDRLPLPHSRDPFYSFLLEAHSILVHTVTGRNISMKNPNDAIENRTRELLSIIAW